ncbi:glycoside hydrolase family 140 protein [Reichenbachiella ulvae]|uniref:Glycoside hydrolase family 140 protein n=1 Tax=Reichenbachiella ulvae TaxID=2980104 RepID=A0ABT3CT07_9BACT|nr:glycoside hydrolase family 140 protein [Reichenbachiella ulvae]MCV9386845.1 glycoside hydrolase family 140 protein [Reichenbachiella ulvae]
MKDKCILKGLLICFFFLFLLPNTEAQELPGLKISDDQRHLVTTEGQPFFWLGGTAWELIHRLTREEVDLYLSDRASKGFTVIQTVVLAELDGLRTPNAYGDLPLTDLDPTQPNEAYFEHVDYVLRKAEALGLYVALLPTWGDKFNKRWGTGPEIFTPENAKSYGQWLANRYQQQSNLIWVLGGDRAPETDTHYQIIRAMAAGIREVDSIHLMSYHPLGAKKATDFFTDQWLDFDMYQSGHSRLAREYDYVIESRKAATPRPIINAEARYENIPDRFWEEQSHGWLDDADVRVSAYYSMMAGASGYTYGCNDIWQMYDERRAPIIQARTDWDQAIHLPGSYQMGYMKDLFEKLPWQQMTMDQSLIMGDNPKDENYQIASLSADRTVAMIYSPTGRPVQADLSKLKANKLQAFWFNPRSGSIQSIGSFNNQGNQTFSPWASGWSSDFLLVLLASDASIDWAYFSE